MHDTYQLRDVERRLAEDERTSELGVQLTEHGGRLFVRGQVSSEAAREAVLSVIREMCPESDVVDEMSCTEGSLSQGPQTAEEIR
jgi:hypothetical protein